MDREGAPSRGRAEPLRRPLATARHVPLFAREIRECLSEAAIEILFSRAEALAEGKPAGPDFFATVMLTIDLAGAPELRDSVDAATARRVASLATGDPRVERRALDVARGQAERLAGASLRDAQADVRVRSAGTRVHLDVDLQARLAASR